MSGTPEKRPVAVVTGASRGIGKGVALELGAAGATVYLTGRGGTGRLPGTLGETAARIADLGGTGVPVVCDHRDDAAVDRLTADLAHDLTGTGVTVVSLWPGIVDTELLQLIPADEAGRRLVTLPGEATVDLAQAETPRFAGRAVVALLRDPGRAALTGKAWRGAELADRYGFTDVDGRVPRTG